MTVRLRSYSESRRSSMSKDSRPAAVAGMFYPESAALLPARWPDAGSAATNPPLRPKAIIVPHAGYVYSGPIAASVYAPIAVLRGAFGASSCSGRRTVSRRGLAVPRASTFSRRRSARWRRRRRPSQHRRSAAGRCQRRGPRAGAFAGSPTALPADGARRLSRCCRWRSATPRPKTSPTVLERSGAATRR
jgi:hypothetical protein